MQSFFLSPIILIIERFVFSIALTDDSNFAFNSSDFFEKSTKKNIKLHYFHIELQSYTGKMQNKAYDKYKD